MTMVEHEGYRYFDGVLKDLKIFKNDRRTR